MSEKSLSHLDAAGQVRMVDVGQKLVTVRRAVAEGEVRISAELAAIIAAGKLTKGDFFPTVRLAGIQAAKRTSELIPLCHPLPLDHVAVEAWLDGHRIRLRAEASATARTGVEMEALTAVAVAALTVIDMGKSVDRSMVIGPIRLLEKTGGVHGPYVARPLIPSSGTPGEGKGGGSSRGSRDKRPPPRPSPGVPGEGEDAP